MVWIRSVRSIAILTSNQQRQLVHWPDLPSACAGLTLSPSLTAVREASDEERSDGEAPPAAAAVPAAAESRPASGYAAPAPSLWQALSTPEDDLANEQLPFDCCDRSVNINQVR